MGPHAARRGGHDRRRGLKNIAETYTGEEGQQRLQAQHYDEAVTIEATKGVGTQVLKFRGGMPLLGMTRVFGMYRLANSMALLDATIRKVGPDQALGRPGLRQLQLAHRPAARPSDGHRASRRSSST